MNVEPNANLDELGDVANFVVEQIRLVAPEKVGDVVTLDMSLYEFGLDSLASMAVVNRIEESLGIRFPEQSLYDLETCRDLVQIIEESMSDRA